MVAPFLAAILKFKIAKDTFDSVGGGGGNAAPPLDLDIPTGDANIDSDLNNVFDNLNRGNSPGLLSAIKNYDKDSQNEETNNGLVNIARLFKRGGT